MYENVFAMYDVVSIMFHLYSEWSTCIFGSLCFVYFMYSYYVDAGNVRDDVVFSLDIKEIVTRISTAPMIFFFLLARII